MLAIAPRAVADLPLENLDAAAQGHSLVAPLILDARKLLLEPRECVGDYVRMQDLSLQACEELLL